MSEIHQDLLVLAARAVSRGFSDAISTVRYAGKRVIVTRQGRPVAAIVSMQDLQRLQAVAPAVAPEGGGDL